MRVLAVKPVLMITRPTLRRTFLPTESLHRDLFSGAVANIAVSLSPGGSLVHCSVEIISEELLVMLRQLSYAINNQLKAPKAPY